MLKIHKRISYALITLNYIKEQEGPTSSREIAEKFNLPLEHIAKVLQSLVRAGIISSIQGPKGGYYLEQDLNCLSYLDLNSAVLGENGFHNCIHSDSCLLYENCDVMLPIQRLGNRIEQLLGQIPVAELLAEANTSTNAICKE
ncbi:RrF2 family transcriptional regulator [Spirochaeta cellobiosiphila]|uniref:RrF2 family transcriptional regulator n=1 Tax=Spirochaeta cellobiosiphila TaxID=504483 RepID=UPI00048A7753|nr:Rrf2 family transcriptional regulator [Spirochaeta cellobiosiphila]